MNTPSIIPRPEIDALSEALLGALEVPALPSKTWLSQDDFAPPVGDVAYEINRALPVHIRWSLRERWLDHAWAIRDAVARERLAAYCRATGQTPVLRETTLHGTRIALPHVRGGL